MRRAETMRQRLDRLQAEDEIRRIAKDYHTWRKLEEKHSKSLRNAIRQLGKEFNRIDPADLTLNIS